MKSIFRFCFLLPWGQKWLTFKTLFWVLYFLFIMKCLPNKYLTRCLGVKLAENLNTLPVNTVFIHQVRRAIFRVRALLPIDKYCLISALTAKKLLAQHHIPNTLYLGVAKDEQEGGIKAHAWLRCGNVIVIGGGKELSRYTVISPFFEDK